jgi:hypothetical protein
MPVTIELDENEEFAVWAVSDAALETVAGPEKGIANHYTLAHCTAMDCALLWPSPTRRTGG